MRQSIVKLMASSAVAALLTGMAVTPSVSADGKKLSVVDQGKQIAENRKKGNCLACHVMGDGKLPGNIGPPLVAMGARYPDKAKLRAQIWDATKRNPNTMMPPFGRHKILSEGEIDKVVEYVHTL